MKAEFIFIAESGALEQQGLLLCESLRKFGGRYAQADIKILQPRRERKISEEGRREFLALRARIVEMSIVSPCPEYGTSYRVFACAAYEPCSRADCLIFMDSDCVLLSEPDLELQGADLAVRPVDVKGMCTSGVGDPKDNYWRELCRICGVDYSRVPHVTTTVDQVRVKASFNGGLTVVRGGRGLFAKTADFFQRSLEAGLVSWPDLAAPFPAGHGMVSVEGGRLWGSSQASLSLAICALGLSARILPASQNFPLHYYPEMLPAIESGAIPMISHLHYHHVFRGNPADNPVLAGKPGFPKESIGWLRDRSGRFA